MSEATERCSRLLDILKHTVRTMYLEKEALNNDIKYLRADFDNYQRRTDREIDERASEKLDRFIIESLDLLDDLEISLAHAKGSGGDAELIKGLQIFLAKFYKRLATAGLEAIKVISGGPFDPRLHVVGATAPVEGGSNGRVIEVLRKGYMLRGKVIRPVVVRVGVEKEVR